ncbi:L-fuculose-phosphate aldolase/HCOMODA/2-hydroxy-3-carboxy-muconic semialdehyde decarboxylase [Actinomycetospora succinea]|uniref:L-fuculose-phosphate aldolase/HCOMODA/2-hydroxy-3-carboxy-muconic semialdehyde decarboxylase n=1 Tax=Actinomycetospora succinea TaxID=663603 RepID=A0A4V3DAI7_9PSEU|nr:class II aldolase/adducin family protein [Actinomycetospora succinea]TDQ62533.1 L-fuculose-phosphate aldolase/HCOMODA/2-hydroxy-3-carboxy-muconic semialdehyde decarboxylase [Actinomycetospora succinea]
MTDTEVHEQTALAARVLAHHGLVTAFGHVSARLGGKIVVTPPTAPGLVRTADLVTVDVDADELPPGAAPETWAHLAVYRARPDVAAVARAQPESAFAAAAVTHELMPLHGQATWLGRRVPVHEPARLLRDPERAAAAARTLADADALLLRGNGALTVGDSPGTAVARMWLLDAACRVHLAVAGHQARALDPDDIEAWREAAPPLLERLWRHLADSS